ncbi:hypothetical protein [Marinobacter sp. 2_MG-2023]|uniref:hypothetical protein n=1 Tax=Marinobacter sp. 2_MG-2023 TaxID=3062679 RepID=UPI0026E3441D|nr:hypothetical protein [Marinobacter sp. 2_MG-2023]MDO6442841.1 hypothetical protein [Marinobacter sp. 2_MG-2023]
MGLATALHVLSPVIRVGGKRSWRPLSQGLLSTDWGVLEVVSYPSPEFLQG